MTEPQRPTRRDEKREKDEEKRTEKQRDEKWRRDPLRGITLAAILIWGGIVGILDFYNVVDWGWSVFFIGTGVILLIKAGLRAMPQWRRPTGGTIIIGLILIGVGIGGLVGWNFAWPIVIIIIGVVILWRTVFHRRP